MPSLTVDSNSPAAKRVRRLVPGDSDLHFDADAQPTNLPAQPNEETMNVEIAQAKQLVKDLKRAIETREAQEDRGADLTDSHRGIKRTQPSSDSVSVSGSSGQERIIKSNKRVKQGGVLLGGVKTVAYGSIILGIGLGLGA